MKRIITLILVAAMVLTLGVLSTAAAEDDGVKLLITAKMLTADGNIFLGLSQHELLTEEETGMPFARFTSSTADPNVGINPCPTTDAANKYAAVKYRTTASTTASFYTLVAEPHVKDIVLNGDGEWHTEIVDLSLAPGDATNTNWNGQFNRLDPVNASDVTVDYAWIALFADRAAAEAYQGPVIVRTRDFDKNKGDGLSYDQIFVNGEMKANGNDAVIELKKLVDGSDGSITSVGMHGWFGNTASPTAAYGYTIDGGDPVFGDFFAETGDDVTASNPNGRRFTITVDVSGLDKGADHEIRAVAKLENGEIVILNRNEPGKDRDIYLIFRAELKEGDSLDAIGVNVKTYSEANPAGLKDLDEITINKGDKMYILGWSYRTYTNLTEIVYTVDGAEKSCADNYRSRNDVAGVFKFSTAYAANSGFGYDDNMMEMTGIDALAAGTYEIKIITKFEDGATHEIKAFTLKVEATPVDLFTETDGGIIWEANYWLGNTDAPGRADITAGAMVNPGEPLLGIGFPTFWSSNSDATDNPKIDATIRLTLYKFDMNIETTRAGTPVASAEFTPHGDNNSMQPFSAEGTGCTVTNYLNNQGILLRFAEPLEAGQYYLEVAEVAQGDGQHDHYLVLPMTKVDEETNAKADYYLNGVRQNNCTARVLLILLGDGVLNDIIPDQEAPFQLKDHVNRDGCSAGGTELGNAETITATVANDVTSITPNLWYAANIHIVKYGYKVDGGEAVWDENLMKTGGADGDAIMAAAVEFCGKGAEGFRFSGAIPVEEGTHEIVLVAALDDGNEKDLWTLNITREAAQTPDEPNPGTGNAVIAFAVIVTLALAAAIVLKKKAF